MDIQGKYTQEQLAIIDRGKRLQGVASQPGWQDVLAISRKILTDAREQLECYPADGQTYDEKTLQLLHARVRTLREHYDVLTATIDGLIQQAFEELNSPQEPEPQF